MNEVVAESKLTTSQHTGKQYWNIKTESGKWANSFEPVEVGDEVILTTTKKGDKEFTNAKKVDQLEERVEETSNKIAGSLQSPPFKKTGIKEQETPPPAASDPIAQVAKLTTDIRQSKADPETLSLALVELALLHETLGTMLAEALEAERSLEMQLKFEKQRDILALRKAGEVTLVEAEAEAVTRAKPLADEWLEAKKSADLFRIKRDDIQKIIDAGRSRLTTIREDIQNG